jgi:hypothetical protein
MLISGIVQPIAHPAHKRFDLRTNNTALGEHDLPVRTSHIENVDIHGKPRQLQVEHIEGSPPMQHEARPQVAMLLDFAQELQEALDLVDGRRSEAGRWAEDRSGHALMNSAGSRSAGT